MVLKLLDECGLRRKLTTIIQRKGLPTSPFFYDTVAEKWRNELKSRETVYQVGKALILLMFRSKHTNCFSTS